MTMPPTELFCKLPKWLLPRKDLRATDKVLYAYLRDRIGSNAFCWPSVRTIAKDCGICPSTVVISIKRLEEAGLIEVAHGDANTPNHYCRATAGSPEDASAECQEPAHPRSENQYTGVPNTSTGASRILAHNETQERDRNRKTHRTNQEPKKISLSDFAVSVSDEEVLSRSGCDAQGMPLNGNGADALAKVLALHLRIPSMPERQYAADCTSLSNMAKAILLGQKGPVKKAETKALAKAQELSASRSVRNRIAAFTTWFKQLGRE